MDCPNRECLSYFHDSLLKPEGMEKIRGHLAECHACRGSLRQLDEIDNLLKLGSYPPKAEGCPAIDEIVSLADFPLAKNESTEALEGHLAVCGVCLNDIAALAALSSNGGEAAEEPPSSDAINRAKSLFIAAKPIRSSPRKKASRSKYRYARAERDYKSNRTFTIAALAVVAVAAVALIIALSTSGTQPRDTVVKDDTSITSPPRIVDRQPPPPIPKEEPREIVETPDPVDPPEEEPKEIVEPPDVPPDTPDPPEPKEIVDVPPDTPDPPEPKEIVDKPPVPDPPEETPDPPKPEPRVEPKPKPEWKQIALKYNGFDKLNIPTPDLEPRQVTTCIMLPHPKNGVFAARIIKGKLHLDTTGDGKLNYTIKKSSGTATFAIAGPHGKRMPYALRFTKKKKAWFYERACCLVGKFKKRIVVLIDEDANGRWNNFGVDAIRIGKRKYASQLSPLVNVGGKLYHVRMETDKLAVSFKEYEGETGLVDLAWLSKDKRSQMCIVKSGNSFFNVAEGRENAIVPTGSCSFVSAFILGGGVAVDVQPGSMSPVTVEKDKVASLKCGGPFKVDFNPCIDSDVITVNRNMQIIGAGGEIYMVRNERILPTSYLRDAKTGRSVGAPTKITVDS